MGDEEMEGLRAAQEIFGELKDFLSEDACSQFNRDCPDLVEQIASINFKSRTRIVEAVHSIFRFYIDQQAKWDGQDLESVHHSLIDLLVLYTEDEGMVARILVSTSQLFMELVISSDFSLRKRASFLGFFNSFFSSTNSGVRKYVGGEIVSYVPQLLRFLTNCGDFTAQGSILETVLRISLTGDQKALLNQWFQDPGLEALFRDIKDFEPDSRLFLNAFNCRDAENSLVHSVPAISGTLGGQCMYKPPQMEHLWVDFSMKSETISSMYVNEPNFDGNWESLLIEPGSVDKVELERRSDGLTLTLYLFSEEGEVALQLGPDLRLERILRNIYPGKLSIKQVEKPEARAGASLRKVSGMVHRGILIQPGLIHSEDKANMELEPKSAHSEVRVVAETTDDDEVGYEEDEEDLLPCAQRNNHSSQGSVSQGSEKPKPPKEVSTAVGSQPPKKSIESVKCSRMNLSLDWESQLPAQSTLVQTKVKCSGMNSHLNISDLTDQDCSLDKKRIINNNPASETGEQSSTAKIVVYDSLKIAAAGRSSKRAADESSKRAANESSKRAADESSKRADESSKRAADESSKRAADESSKRAADESSKRAADESSKRAADESSKRAADASSKRAADASSKRAADKTSKYAADKSSKSSDFRVEAIKAAETAADKASRILESDKAAMIIAAERAAKMATDRTIKAAYEKAKMKVSEKALKITTDKAAIRTSANAAKNSVVQKSNRLLTNSYDNAVYKTPDISGNSSVVGASRPSKSSMSTTFNGLGFGWNSLSTLITSTPANKPLVTTSAQQRSASDTRATGTLKQAEKEDGKTIGSGERSVRTSIAPKARSLSLAEKNVNPTVDKPSGINPTHQYRTGPKHQQTPEKKNRALGCCSKSSQDKAPTTNPTYFKNVDRAEATDGFDVEANTTKSNTGASKIPPQTSVLKVCGTETHRNSRNEGKTADSDLSRSRRSHNRSKARSLSGSTDSKTKNKDSSFKTRVALNFDDADEENSEILQSKPNDKEPPKNASVYVSESSKVPSKSMIAATESTSLHFKEQVAKKKTVAGSTEKVKDTSVCKETASYSNAVKNVETRYNDVEESQKEVLTYNLQENKATTPATIKPFDLAENIFTSQEKTMSGGRLRTHHKRKSKAKKLSKRALHFDDTDEETIETPQNQNSTSEAATKVFYVPKNTPAPLTDNFKTPRSLQREEFEKAAKTLKDVVEKLESIPSQELSEEPLVEESFIVAQPDGQNRNESETPTARKQFYLAENFGSRDKTMSGGRLRAKRTRKSKVNDCRKKALNFEVDDDDQAEATPQNQSNPSELVTKAFNVPQNTPAPLSDNHKTPTRFQREESEKAADTLKGAVEKLEGESPSQLTQEDCFVTSSFDNECGVSGKSKEIPADRSPVKLAKLNKAKSKKTEDMDKFKNNKIERTDECNQSPNEAFVTSSFDSHRTENSPPMKNRKVARQNVKELESVGDIQKVEVAQLDEIPEDQSQGQEDDFITSSFDSVLEFHAQKEAIPVIKSPVATMSLKQRAGVKNSMRRTAGYLDSRDVTPVTGSKFDLANNKFTGEAQKTMSGGRNRAKRTRKIYFDNIIEQDEIKPLRQDNTSNMEAEDCSELSCTPVQLSDSYEKGVNEILEENGIGLEFFPEHFEDAVGETEEDLGSFSHHSEGEDMFITSSIDSVQEESLSKKAEVSSPPYKRRRTIRANLDSSTTKEMLARGSDPTAERSAVLDSNDDPKAKRPAVGGSEKDPTGKRSAVLGSDVDPKAKKPVVGGSEKDPKAKKSTDVGSDEEPPAAKKRTYISSLQQDWTEEPTPPPATFKAQKSNSQAFLPPKTKQHSEETTDFTHEEEQSRNHRVMLTQPTTKLNHDIKVPASITPKVPTISITETIKVAAKDRKREREHAIVDKDDRSPEQRLTTPRSKVRVLDYKTNKAGRGVQKKPQFKPKRKAAVVSSAKTRDVYDFFSDHGDNSPLTLYRDIKAKRSSYAERNRTLPRSCVIFSDQSLLNSSSESNVTPVARTPKYSWQNPVVKSTKAVKEKGRDVSMSSSSIRSREILIQTAGKVAAVGSGDLEIMRSARRSREKLEVSSLVDASSRVDNDPFISADEVDERAQELASRRIDSVGCSVFCLQTALRLTRFVLADVAAITTDDASAVDDLCAELRNVVKDRLNK